MNNYGLDFWKNANKNGYQKAIGSRSRLHNNSLELMEFIKQHRVFDNVDSVFEIGCGAGRNLFYLNQIKPEITISGNDLIKEECFKYMDPSVKEKIDFHEIDTRSLFLSKVINCDLLLSSDHLMHLEPEHADVILDAMCYFWKPTKIVIRERLLPREDKPPFIFVHNYQKLEDKYTVEASQKSAHDSSYEIRFLRRK